MYKDFYMTGWSCRDVTADDVKLMPIIGGRGKQCRGGVLSHMTTPYFWSPLYFTQLLLLGVCPPSAGVLCGWSPLRVLNTVGVARGLGDHDLLAKYSGVKCKEFLTPQPEVSLDTKVIPTYVGR